MDDDVKALILRVFDEWRTTPGRSPFRHDEGVAFARLVDAALAAPLPRMDAVQALVKKWREEALKISGPVGGSAYADELHFCGERARLGGRDGAAGLVRRRHRRHLPRSPLEAVMSEPTRYDALGRVDPCGAYVYVDDYARDVAALTAQLAEAQRERDEAVSAKDFHAARAQRLQDAVIAAQSETAALREALAQARWGKPTGEIHTCPVCGPECAC